MDGMADYPSPSYPAHLMRLRYKELSSAGNTLEIGNTYGKMMKSNIQFEEGQWYKFTITGKPIRSDGQIMWNDWRNPNQKPAMCRQEYLVEGPGLIGDNNEWSSTIDTYCLRLQDDFPLKVFGTQGLWRSKPMDGVLRNVIFENTATKISVDTTCQ